MNNKLKCEVLCEKQNNSFAWLKNVEQLFDCAQFTLFFNIYKHIIINKYSKAYLLKVTSFATRRHNQIPELASGTKSGSKRSSKIKTLFVPYGHPYTCDLYKNH